ncbi:MAG: hypothetical protein A2015_07840 [Spirochaetes bacterium GWF1_31_7]|nr:MAG: hypothetical protein A2Y30_01930 [Spirochaetes bacterium GWE1_32_154]OHD46952.1 MAG: hypothetical protein A2015_07840 [Spirochaetes bacterium GWF1_31_7]OHD48730.1 MAG: hypothetical protein A2Y29_14065 [Spirochaetes bacterium GWE2_31_10]OHD80534.1 MAG: hypothetical protein A2355_16860 [Spirochaetes bacterium RIFOXYB1_FULL_32_8]
MNSLVSVIIPVYNRSVELVRAVRSVVSQSYTNLEILIIDDGSDKPVRDIVSCFDDSRIIILENKKNMGVSFSRNVGINYSKGDYIALLDSDDEWFSDKIARQLDYFISHPVRIVHTEEIWVRNGVRVNQGKRHKKEAGDIFIRSLDLCLISPSSVIMHRSIFDEFGFFREDLPVCEDYDLWLRITAQEKVGFIEEPLIYKYGGHDDQLSRKFHSMDKYRVLSMIGVLKSSILNDEKRSALIATIQGKCSILINGATKREKFDEVDFYLDLLNEVNGFSGI